MKLYLRIAFLFFLLIAVGAASLNFLRFALSHDWGGAFLYLVLLGFCTSGATIEYLEIKATWGDKN